MTYDALRDLRQLWYCYRQLGQRCGFTHGCEEEEGRRLLKTKSSSTLI